MKKTLLTIAGAALLSTSVQAEQYWADNSISALYGSSYEEPFQAAGTDTYSTITLEHVSGHSWGGLFYFVDRSSGEGFTDTYLEISPTFTIAKMDGAISSIGAAYTLESGSGFDNHLFGISAGLSVPGMDYLNINLYRAVNDKIGIEKGDDNLFSVVYGYSNGNFIIDGFMDYRFGNDDGTSFGDVEDSMNLTPQITYNLAPMLGLKNKLKVGIEYSYWTNKYGSTEDQNAVSLLLKAHL